MSFMLPRKRWFYISSGTQLSETVSTWSQEINLPADEEFDRIVMTQALIPLSYYLIPVGQNMFTLIENGVNIPVYVPPGNYTKQAFASTISTLLNNASLNSVTYTVTYPDPTTSADTGKFTYTAETNSVTIAFDFTDAGDIALVFGFDRFVVENFIVYIGISVLISANVVDFTAENTVVIHSNLVTDEAGTDILQEIVVGNTNPGTNITYFCPDPLAYSKKLSSNGLRFASFSLTDEFNSPIFLNGLDVVLTIMVYKEPEFFQQAEKFFKACAHYMMEPPQQNVPSEF